MIVHIVPTVPPDLNGLADYCFKLSQNWPDKSVVWGCLTLHIPADASQTWPESTFRRFEPSQQSLAAALNDLPIDTLILHYVNYAYHPKGVPTWLPVVLKRWKTTHPKKRLIVMFHELWAVGAPWRSCFWVLPAAKGIVAELMGASDYWVTSCQNYFDKAVSVGALVERGVVIPIATGIEPNKPIDFARAWPLFADGKIRIAVFGLASTRNTALSIHAKLLKLLCEQKLVERISVLGQSPKNERDLTAMEDVIAQVGHHSLWSREFDLSPSQASTLLQQHHIGLVKDSAPFLTKSSVYAVLCSHGILPICAGKTALDETSASPFLVNYDIERCVEKIQDEEFVKHKKKNIETAATTSLSWASVARNWVRHIERSA